MPQPPATSVPPADPVSAQEWKWLALAVILGSVVRLAFLDRVAVEHFDEGVYAANVWFGAEEGYQYPLRQFYAPPLLPTLIEWCYIAWSLTGMDAPAWLPMVPGLACGIATIPSAWWIARRWFGPTAGYVAMWLVALNEFHAAYSRTALTDVPVTLAILWAVFAAWKLLLDPTVKNGLLTGAVTAIAWWLKYSGWLPLAILLVGGGVFQCFLRPEQRRWRAWAIATGVGILTAGLLWIPVYRDCLSVGGYSAIAANHRGYIMGWSAWWANIVTHDHAFARYCYQLTPLSFAAAVSVPFGGKTWVHMTRTNWIRIPVVILAVAVFLFDPATMFWGTFIFMALMGIACGVFENRRSTLPVPEVAACALASTWFCGLLVTTPLYQPYPRLLVPWWMASTLLTTFVIGRLASPGTAMQELRSSSGVPPIEWRRALMVGTLIVVIVVLDWPMSWAIPRKHDRLWEARDGFRKAALSAADSLRAQSDAIAQVYGLPPVVIALRERGVAAVVCGGPEAAARLDGSWLVVSSDAERDSTWNDHWPKVADQFELVSTIPIQPSSIVRLDNGPMPADPPPVEVRLYRHR
ncbi:MAG TPA: glycosyltransferase family 39 protein [Planctomycetaceae bacterium]|nr:glycosyltransferase family 39 protein [Planctomycetaceae bacterium]